MSHTFFIAIALAFVTVNSAYGQFNTIHKRKPLEAPTPNKTRMLEEHKKKMEKERRLQEIEMQNKRDSTVIYLDSILHIEQAYMDVLINGYYFPFAHARNRIPRSTIESGYRENAEPYDVNIPTTKRFKSRHRPARNSRLPELTIPNLLREIKRNGILYPEVVLAQAILETGWFRSPVCRYKHNLFGLTDPRTKTYYEFNHWTESVKAYYTKVQYRYKGGNYLLWLNKIGYAEAKDYVRAVIRVMRQLRKT